MTTYAPFIFLWGLANLVLAISAVREIRKNKTGCDFIWWWASFSGAFVWEDMLVLGVLHALLALVSLLAHNDLLWVVMFLVFWIVRSAGETLYFFLEQFVVPVHHPHNITAHFKPLRQVFGNISDQKCYILMQVIFQSIMVISILCLLYVLRHFSF